MNLLIDNYISKDCAGSGDDYAPMPPWKRGVGDKVGVKVKEYMFLFLWQIIGLISTLTALTIVKQLALSPLNFHFYS
ncbi:MAG: hypothetical protein JSV23_11150 [Promethearchaeota archaeon]|nr:MAG: hypothetical protein JSV23_11150 [Candidatus Lokiarchaeota archaeon]